MLRFISLIFIRNKFFIQDHFIKRFINILSNVDYHTLDFSN